MKKFLLIALIMVAALGTQAQKLDKAKDYLKNKELDKAKTEIDGVLATPKGQKNTEAWITKAKVYGEIAASDKFKTLVEDGRSDAFEAIKKAVEIDKNQAGVFLALDNYQPLYVLYTTYFDVGANQYNAEKYTDALTTFQKAGNVGQFIFSQGWGLYALDTTLTYYAGLAAMNAKRDDEAAASFQKLAEAKIGGKPEYATIYRFLAKYYLDKKDEANMSKYVGIGKQLYPKDEYLPLVEFDFLRDKGDKKAVYAKYEEMINSTPTYELIVDYANDLFNETHTVSADKRPADYAQRVVKIEALYKKALELKPDGLEATQNLAKHYFNQALAVEDSVSNIKGKTPDDVKKKAEMNARVLALCDQSIPHFEKIVNELSTKSELKPAERSELKSAYNNLAFCYDRKKDKAKVDFYQKKYDELDKK